MRIVKPAWVNHDGHPIFAIDIHPDGSRFATGGQGGDAGRVCIWNMGPVINPEEEKKENIPKLLCKLDNHLACVNCIRWSHSGRWLASGSDDRVIMIWQHGGHVNMNSGFGGGNVEPWRPISYLRGHAMEVLDLAWSPGDTMLATASPDNTVIIWNTAKWGEVIHTLRGHSALVKGVTWDPMGKFIASQSDDKSLRIWRTKDWKQETVITEPFKDCGGTTHVLRLNWSPDGQFLVSAHAMNNAGSTAQIIERKDWGTDKDFVGHRKAVTCVRFNSHILWKKISSEESSKKDGHQENHVDNKNHKKLNGTPSTKSNKPKRTVCLALGSRDRSLSIWMTCLQRPLAVLHDLFDNSVMDISWSKCGYKLMACSWDGTMAFIEFSESELGKPMSKDEVSSYIMKLYGKGALEPEVPRAKKEEPPALCLIEDPDVLRAQEESKNESKNETDQASHQSCVQSQQSTSSQGSLINGANNRAPHSDLNRVSIDSQSQACSSPTRSSLIKGPIDRQIETKLPDGRRRITPLFIPPPTSSDGIPRPFSVTPDNNLLTSSSQEGKTKIVIERVDASKTPPQLTPKPDLSSSSVSDNAQNENRLPPPLESKSVPNTPSLYSENHRHSSDAAKSHTKRKVSDDHRPASEPKKKHSRPTTVYSQPSPPTINPPSQPSITAPVQSFDTVSQIPSNFSCVPSQISAPLPVTTSISTHQSPTNILPPLKLDKSASIRIVAAATSSTNYSLDIENQVLGTSLHALRLRCVSTSQTSSQKESLWEVICAAKICGVAGSEFIACCACEDQTLSVFDMKSGARKLPPIVLNSPASKLHAEGYKLMLVTSTAHLWLWDLSCLFTSSTYWGPTGNRDRKESPLLLLKNEALAPLLISPIQEHNKSTPIAITSIGLIDGCSPIVNLTNGRSYLYDFSLSSWTLITARSDLLFALCDKQPTSSGSSQDSNKLHAIDSLHRIPPSTYKSVNALGSSSARPLMECATLSCIDQKLVSCLSLNSDAEFKFWFLELINQSVKQNCESRLRQICADLIGPRNHAKSSNELPSSTRPSRRNRVLNKSDSKFSVEMDDASNWQPTIMGHDKRGLLREVLNIIAKNVRLQRLYTEYRDLLDFVTKPKSPSDKDENKSVLGEEGPSTPDTLNSARKNDRDEGSPSSRHKDESDLPNRSIKKQTPSSSSSSSYSSPAPAQATNGVDESEDNSQTPMDQEPSTNRPDPNTNNKPCSPPSSSCPDEPQQNSVHDD